MNWIFRIAYPYSWNRKPGICVHFNAFAGNGWKNEAIELLIPMGNRAPIRKRDVSGNVVDSIVVLMRELPIWIDYETRLPVFWNITVLTAEPVELN